MLELKHYRQESESDLDQFVLQRLQTIESQIYFGPCMNLSAYVANPLDFVKEPQPYCSPFDTTYISARVEPPFVLCTSSLCRTALQTMAWKIGISRQFSASVLLLSVDRTLLSSCPVVWEWPSPELTGPFNIFDLLRTGLRHI
jgi:hypothetical protein